jgi:hypothetical protein
MSGRNAFDRQLEREIDHLAGPEPRVDVRQIVEGATRARRHDRFVGWFGSVPSMALTGVLAVAIVLGLGFLWFERSVVVDPAATPSAEPSPSVALDDVAPAVSRQTPVTGTWSLPEPRACRPQMPTMDENWIATVEVCEGLRFEVVDDPRMSGTGYLRQETWHTGTAPEIWRLSNSGGSWESLRYQDHDRFIFRGDDDYDGLTAVVTLAKDGTLSGFVRAAGPREDDG